MSRILIDNSQPTPEYQEQRKYKRYTYRDICDIVQTYRFESKISGTLYEVQILDIEFLVTHEQFDRMTRFNDYGDTVRIKTPFGGERRYSEFDAETLYSIVRGQLEVEALVLQFRYHYPDKIVMIAKDDSHLQALRLVSQLSDDIYENMRKTEVKAVGTVQTLSELGKTDAALAIRDAAKLWKEREILFMNTVNEIVEKFKNET